MELKWSINKIETDIKNVIDSGYNHTMLLQLFQDLNTEIPNWILFSKNQNLKLEDVILAILNDIVEAQRNDDRVLLEDALENGLLALLEEIKGLL